MFPHGSVYFYIVLQACYDMFLIPPSTYKTCVVYPLQPLDSAHFFCFLYLANFQKVKTRLLTPEKVLIGIKTLHIWINQKRGMAQSRSLGREQVGIVNTRHKNCKHFMSFAHQKNISSHAFEREITGRVLWWMHFNCHCHMSSGPKLINKTNWLIWLSILIAFKTNDQQINESIRAQHNPLMKCCHSGNTYTVRTLLSLTSLALHVSLLYMEAPYGRMVNVEKTIVYPRPWLFHCKWLTPLISEFIFMRPTERSISPWVKELDRDFAHEILWCPPLSLTPIMTGWRLFKNIGIKTLWKAFFSPKWSQCSWTFTVKWWVSKRCCGLATSWGHLFIIANHLILQTASRI